MKLVSLRNHNLHKGQYFKVLSGNPPETETGRKEMVATFNHSYILRVFPCVFLFYALASH